MERLTAKQNEKIKHAVSVRDSARVRREEGLFFLEGARLCRDAAVNNVRIFRAFVTESAMEKYADYADAVLSAAEEGYIVSSDVAEKLSDTRSTQGIFCLCRVQDNTADIQQINPKGKYIFLENVQDPSNLGAVCRTAEAIGVDGMIICGGCDIYNPKALRASMGSALRLPIMTCADAVSFIEELNTTDMLTLASTPDSGAVPVTEIDMAAGVVCVVGNEGNGVTDATMSACKHRVTIPMLGRAESLNASTAAAILIWEMMRK
ncbi:MAG: RNA methyltransferase [Clostridia bacterium]|nr:RNA methyltransferase [Clostridia bacterium]